MVTSNNIFGTVHVEVARNPVLQREIASLTVEEQLSRLNNIRNEPPGVRRLRAKLALMKHWGDIGGPSSDVGLPLDNAFPLIARPNGMGIGFRGGVMNYNENEGTIVIEEPTHVVVRLEGYGLDIRQESGDELCGTISGIVPSTGYRPGPFTLPQETVGPDDNDRIRMHSTVLYEGPPAALNLIINMIEVDEDEARDVAISVAQEAAQKGFDAGVGAAAAQGGPAAEVAVQAAMKESGADEAIHRWINSGVQSFFDRILGTGNDPYAVGVLSIPAAEMVNIPPIQQYRCQADARVVDYTHKRTVSGRDDGSDLGQITLLFTVKRS